MRVASIEVSISYLIALDYRAVYVMIQHDSPRFEHLLASSTSQPMSLALYARYPHWRGLDMSCFDRRAVHVIAEYLIV